MNAKLRAEEEARKRESDLYKKFKKKEKRRTELIQKKLEERNKQERLMYENDQKHYMNLKNSSMTRKKEEDEEVDKALEQFEKKMIKHEQNKFNFLSSKTYSKNFDLGNKVRVNSVTRKGEKSPQNLKGDNLNLTSPIRVKTKEQIEEEELQFRLRIEKSVKNQQLHKENREKHLLDMKRTQHQRLQREHERFMMNMRQREVEVKQKNKDIMKRIQDKNRPLSFKRVHDSDLEVKKENQRLRRENQLLNYRREVAMKDTYKSQLIDQLIEKKERADKAKERSKTAGIPNGLNINGI